MIEIKELEQKDIIKAIEIKESCWPEEIQGKSKAQFERENELAFWSKWMISSAEITMIENYMVRLRIIY